MSRAAQITPELVDAMLESVHLGVSGRRIAKAAGVDPMTLVRAEQRGRTPDAPAHLQRLAAAFDAVGETGEYWEHRQAAALGRLERMAQRQNAGVAQG